MAKIDEPLRAGKWTLPNRVVLQPMEGCDGTAAGGIGELTRRRYLRLAESDAGLLWFEAISVCPEGRANPRQLFLHEGTAESYQRLLAEIRERALAATGRAPKIVAQLTHSGRFAKPMGIPAPLVAYRNALWEEGKEAWPYEIVTDKYCAKVADDYEKAARLAMAVGFDGVDVKCCHGYLLGEFLSAYDRAGPYGGSFENRTRLFFECLEAVRRAMPADMVLTTRLNACDGFAHPHGYGTSARAEYDLGECKEILRVLRDRFGCAVVNITLGNPYLIPHINRPARNEAEPPEAGMRRIRAVTRELQMEFPELALVASGLSYPGANAVAYADQLLEEGTAALTGFGRMIFAYPQFYRDYRCCGQLDKRKTCTACGKCTQLMRAGSVTGCVVRDGETYMPYYQQYVLEKGA